MPHLNISHIIFAWFLYKLDTMLGVGYIKDLSTSAQYDTILDNTISYWKGFILCANRNKFMVKELEWTKLLLPYITCNELWPLNVLNRERNSLNFFNDLATGMPAKIHSYTSTIVFTFSQLSGVSPVRTFHPFILSVISMLTPF